jgi:hypothetical protein
MAGKLDYTLLKKSVLFMQLIVCFCPLWVIIAPCFGKSYI